MDAVKDEVIGSLKVREGNVRELHLEYLRREKSVYDTPEKKSFIDGVKHRVNERCIFVAALRQMPVSCL